MVYCCMLCCVVISCDVSYCGMMCCVMVYGDVLCCDNDVVQCDGYIVQYGIITCCVVLCCVVMYCVI